MILGRRKLVLIGVVVVVAALAFGVFQLPLLSVTANTDGVAYDFRNVLGGSNTNGGGDLLDSTSYVTSWTGGGASEKIVIQGHFKGTGSIFASDFTRYWYKVTLSVDNSNVQINGATGTTWTSNDYTNPIWDAGTPWSAGNWGHGQAVTLTLTNPCSGKVHVEMWAHINDLNPWSNDDGLLAVDEGYVRSGVGSVKVQNDVVEEGQNANFFVETAFAHSDKSSVPSTDEGWILNVYNPSGTSVFSKSIGDNFAGTISYPIPSGAYSSTSSNIYKVILRNELIDQDDDWFFTIGQGMTNQIPGLPSFEITAGEPPYHAGDQITVAISAKKVANPISGFWVWVSYETSVGTTTHYIYEKKWYAATPTATGGTASVSFTFPDAGNARLEASTADSMNLNSGMAEMKWTVYGTNGGGHAALPFDWTQFAYVIVVLIAGVVVWFFVPIPRQFKIIMLIVLIALAFYFAWPLMTTDYSAGATWIPGGME